jgi:anaerobic glycerol-3-phosphate dehydrogenase
MLVDWGANIYKHDRSNLFDTPYTAAEYAAGEGNADILAKILEADAHRFYSTPNQLQALLKAAKGNEAIQQMLVHHALDQNSGSASPSASVSASVSVSSSWSSSPSLGAAALSMPTAEVAAIGVQPFEHSEFHLKTANSHHSHTPMDDVQPIRDTPKDCGADMV